MDNKDSRYFLDKGYEMRFNTPRGGYTSKKYSLQKHLEHYFLFFVEYPLLDNTNFHYGFSFPDINGAVVYLCEYLLKESVSIFEEIDNINLHFNDLMHDINDNGHGATLTGNDFAFLDIHLLMLLNSSKIAINICESHGLHTSIIDNHKEKIKTYEKYLEDLKDFQY